MDANLGLSLQFANYTSLAAGLGLVLLLVVFLLRRFRGRQVPAWALWSSLTLRLLTVALLLAALARPQLARATDVLNEVFVIDGSASIADSSRAAALSFAEQSASKLKPDDRVGVVLFGAIPVVTQPLGPYSGHLSLRVPGAAEQGLDGSLKSQTNLAAALNLASSLFPPDGSRRLVLFTDGNETAGSAAKHISSLIANGVHVMAVPLQPLTGSREVLIESLETPSVVREEESFDSIVTVRSTEIADATLRFWRDGVLVAQEKVKLHSGANRFALSQKAKGEGFHSFRVEVSSAADTLPQNNVAFSYTTVRPKAAVLVLEGAPGNGQAVRQALTEQGITVNTLPASRLPTDPASLDNYQGIVLVDAPASAWSSDQMKAIQSYVHDRGRGLVVLGGKHSFGPGGYSDTALDAVLPVSSVPPSEKQQMSVSVLLIIDKSGSMTLDAGGTEKMQMAKEAAVRAAESLSPQDEVGVLAFDIEPTWIVSPQPLNAPGALDSVKQRIGEIEADGGTDIYSALQAGYEVLRTRRTVLKHIILMTDGDSQGRSDYDQLLAQIARDKITVSTLAIGEDANKSLLQRMAKAGNGRYYATDNALDIPNMVVQDTQLANRPYLVEKPFSPQVSSASPVLQGLTDSLPSLGGYVVTTPKPSAQVVVSSPLSDPLLSQWQYGLGRVVAWTSSADYAWGSNWLAWKDFSQFWAQAVRWSLPSPADGPLQVRAVVDGQHVTVSADALNADQSFRDLTDTVATVLGPEGTPSSILLSQSAPGRYEGQLPAGTPGAYMVQVRQYGGGSPAPTAICGFVVPPAPELSRLSVNQGLLEELTSSTGGKILTAPAEAAARPDRPEGRQTAELWPWLLGIGLGLFLLDVIVRRLWILVEDLPWLGRNRSRTA